MAIELRIRESPKAQKFAESVIYTLTSTPWGTSPSVVSVIVYDITDGEPYTDVTSTVMPTNSPSILGDVITFSPLKLLTRDHKYLMDIFFTCNSKEFNTDCIIVAV